MVTPENKSVLNMHLGDFPQYIASDPAGQSDSGAKNFGVPTRATLVADINKCVYHGQSSQYPSAEATASAVSVPETLC
jgi:hypothetical protein